MGDTKKREVFKGLIENGVGRYNYQVYANEDHYLYLECDKTMPATYVNHSCQPNAIIEEVS